MSLYGPQYKNEQGNIVDLPINAKKLDGYSYNDYSKYYTTSSTTENAFLVTIPYVKALSDGLVIHCQFHTATKSGATLNVNSLGAKGIYYRYATAITTHIVANNYVDLIYSASIDKWVLLFSYDANSNTLGYQVRTNNGSYYNGASTSCYRYQILVETTNGLEAFTSTNSSTGTSKTQLSPKYIPNGEIRYYSGTNEVKTKGKFSSTALWQQYQGINLKYSFNIGTITKDSPCYIKMSRNTDGTLKPVYSATSGGHPLVFALPTTKDGYYYTYLGRTYEASSTVYLELELCHPTFYYDGGIRTYDGTYLYDWAKASTKPTYTASEVGALPDTTTIPTKTSDLTNDSGYITGITSSDVTTALGYTPGTSNFSGSYSDLTNKPSIFSFTSVISTQEITIKNLQTGIYLLTFAGTKKIHTSIGEVSNHELVLETGTTYNNILIANRFTATMSGNTVTFVHWKLMCPFSNTTLYQGSTHQTVSSNGTISWTGEVYGDRFVQESMYISYEEPSSSDTNYYYPLYRDSVIVTDETSGQRKDQYNLLKTGPKYAGGTSVTLNGTNKSSNTASLYAPTSSGTSGQFLKSKGANASPTWTSLADVATSGSYDDLTDTPSISNATITIKQTGHNDQTFTLNGNATTISLADTTYSSKTASSGGTEVSLVTTGEKYTWNNKQDKISTLGSTTKPVYFSSNGVASECSTYAGGTAVTLNGTSKASSTASFYAPTSVGTNGQLLSSNGSSLTWTNDNRSLLHHDLGVTLENTTTDGGWGMFNSSYNGFLLKSVRFNANSPSWGVGDFGSGIVFGGSDTKGVVSVAYRTPDIKIAGGNGSGPVWWIGLTGTSATSYDLDKLNPNEVTVRTSGSISTGAKNMTSITLLTIDSSNLTKGVWKYSGTYGVILFFITTAITTQGSPKMEYITGYVSNSIPSNTTLTLTEV